MFSNKVDRCKFSAASDKVARIIIKSDILFLLKHRRIFGYRCEWSVCDEKIICGGFGGEFVNLGFVVAKAFRIIIGSVVIISLRVLSRIC